jgi:hypothetical protein
MSSGTIFSVLSPELKRKAGGSPLVDQQGQAQPDAGFRLFIDGGEGGVISGSTPAGGWVVYSYSPAQRAERNSP